ncbi:MAG: sulfite exporter TauE/SafE family protein [Terracidiphilus sp.]
MPYAIGFLIAMFIALTGVGAGTLTVPVLVLFLGVPAPEAVGIGLIFSAAVKLILVPTQILHRNVAWRTLGFMLLGGVPGVLIGSLFLRHLMTAGSQNLINALLGAILVGTASWQILYSFRPMQQRENARDRSRLLAGLMFPVGAEVGFSSAGAGALGSAALLSLTPLAPAQVVGTDIAFGFIVSLIGSGAHWFSQASDPGLLLQLIAGGIVGAIGGTLLSTRVPRRPLRIALWIWLLILGGQFLLNSYEARTVSIKQTATRVHANQLK